MVKGKELPVFSLNSLAGVNAEPGDWDLVELQEKPAKQVKLFFL